MTKTATATSMAASSKCLDLIKKWEGLRLNAYLDSGGVPTIGYGHTKDVAMGQTVTKDEAEYMLAMDVLWAEKCVNDTITATLNQNQFDAVVSFIYNVGPGKSAIKDGFVTLKSGLPSTMRRKINAGDMAGAALEFTKWNLAGGKPLLGLTRRRKEEKELFESQEGL